MIQDWLRQNAWTLIVTLVALVMAWANLNAQVKAIDNDHSDLAVRLVAIESLTERIVHLEEGRQINANNIIEIKNDIKDLKAHFKIP